MFKRLEALSPVRDLGDIVGDQYMRLSLSVKSFYTLYRVFQKSLSNLKLLIL